ncbi:MAG: cobalamin-independent methionine synthase II family protein [Candidatus Handelsmanbacteria bacterium]|nr:cobalamin-independent methionine synthase II family protein [Candidatus Handelsmanbacteria bacterium]
MPIKTTVVGSYPVPDWLAALPSEQALLDAMRVVFKIQEEAGIDLVADGELYRFDVNHPDTNGMIEYFVRPLRNVRNTLGRTDVAEFRRDQGMSFRARPSGVVEGPLGEGALDLPADCRRARYLTRAPLKFTLTGPHMLCKTLLDRHYGSRPELCQALASILAAQVADLDAEVVQVDEANLPGHPEEWEWALAGINQVLDAVITTPAVHLCFGNYGGQTIQRGSWEKLLAYLSGLHCDHVLLELAHRGNWELPFLKELSPKVRLGLGVVDIKSNVVESADQIARRIEEAATALGEERLAYVNPDCGFWMLKRSVADRKIRALVEGRDLYAGRG